MNMKASRRTATPNIYDWWEGDKATPGIALMSNRNRRVAHYTETEARALADQLHDLCDYLAKNASQEGTK